MLLSSTRRESLLRTLGRLSKRSRYRFVQIRRPGRQILPRAAFTGVSATLVESLSKYQAARGSCPERIRIGFFQQQWHAARIFSLSLARLFTICGTEAWFGFCYQLVHFQLRRQPTHSLCCCCRAQNSRHEGCKMKVGASPMPTVTDPTERAVLIRDAFRLEWLSIAWMVIEGSVAIAAGIIAHSVLLVAFGIDSVIELASAGVLLWR
jgi:hypothetical protein